jgi:hypothetical protein
MKNTILLAAALGLMVPAGSAMAAPVVKFSDAGGNSLVQHVASWRYHDNCGWSGGRWVVDLGAGKIVACRPRRPEGNWGWRHEGNHEGWYDKRRSAWHYDKW